MSDSTYDFIIVGGGTAGCLLAHRLAHTQSRPSVLVVEAGPKPEGEHLRAPYHRFAPAFTRPDLDYEYSTIPQKELNGRVVPYNRGKGLGGSSILNFAVYLYGSSEDYNRWAELVGDDAWKWENTLKSFQAIENYDTTGSKDYPHLANPDSEVHGKSGQVQICVPPVLEKGFASHMEAVIEAGEKVNLDANSGDPVGISVFPASYGAEGRSTSATAHLLNSPDNLTIWTGATVQRLVFEGTKVVGVKTTDGRTASARHDTIITGGSIDTPRLLLVNGIGPAKELEALSIKVVKDLPGVGKGLHDHVMTFLCVEIDGSHNDRYAFESNENMMLEADAQWKNDHTGRYSLDFSGLWGGFLKLPELENLPEFKGLDESMQRFLLKDKVPAYEFTAPSILFPPGTPLEEGNTYLSAVAFLMNAQSEGSITLSSSNPDDKPVIDFAYLTHPYDKRIMRESVRQSWIKLFENPAIKPLIKRRLYGPETLSDEDVDAFVKDAAGTVWHANGTVVMGKPENPKACVDTSFRVYGVQGLRVADLSVCPVTTNNHTQATAYLVGQKAAEKLIAEYQLDTVGSSKL
ncbi:GMC oxidoreductase [Aaosphaeria arxii CBS 175.79]|uniref:GMC oxidoreductase n=1 Tax=Aaosphaeria arxii CBS 175.79 TaxID=1450172 RepID=A0A6A5XAW6_9PLEO|nr:GMC oxidoreductase [Aaosphaeria arxii CBS 175.79]KAF2010118.1 GMC oxidoreductase [Aaosphaeria arxii CBS 175.79]